MNQLRENSLRIYDVTFSNIIFNKIMTAPAQVIDMCHIDNVCAFARPPPPRALHPISCSLLNVLQVQQHPCSLRGQASHQEHEHQSACSQVAYSFLRGARSSASAIQSARAPPAPYGTMQSAAGRCITAYGRSIVA